MARLSKILFIIITAFLLLGISAEPALAIWQALFVEYYDKDQQNPNLRWPWITHRQNNPPANPPAIKRWYHNPRNWPTANPRNSNNGWGWQDYLFNSYVRQNEEIPGSMWCAYCTERGPNEPQWPDRNQYWANTNSWAFWGPFSTEGWAAGVVTYWYYMDLARYARDSLSVVMLDSDDFITSNGNDFRNNVAFGYSNGIRHTYAVGSNGDWQYRYFHMDSMQLGGEQFSMLDQPYVWLAFVFQSDGIDIAGTGAYIDDVQVLWDDGLFDIVPVRSYLGYQINEDSIHWTDQKPSEDDTVKFRLDYRVVGAGQTPDFTIQLKMDEEIVYAAERSVMAGDTTYTIIADYEWVADVGIYNFIWELDTPIGEGGRVEESNENNNTTTTEIEIAWNPAPMFQIVTPDVDSIRIWEQEFQLQWTVDDSNETDNQFRIYFYWTKDTTGWAETPDMMFDYPDDQFITALLRAPRGQGAHSWNYSRLITQGHFEQGDVLWIMGFASDGQSTTFAIAPGTLFIEPLNAPNESPVLPTSVALNRTYPNPFNRSITIEYALPAQDYVRLSVFDLHGRHITDLVDRVESAGNHSISWNAVAIPAGVYLLRMEAASQVHQKKIVYMP